MSSACPTMVRRTSPARAFSVESKPRVLFVIDSVLGHVTVHLRGLMFQEMFRRHGWDVDFVNLRTSGRRKLNSWTVRRAENKIVRAAKKYDVVYLLKIASKRLVQRLRSESDVRVAFDLTDALWQPIHRAHGWNDLEDILRLSDAITSENDFICAYGRKFNDTVLSIPVCTQIERFDRLCEQVPPRSDDRVIFGWVGSPGTVAALESIRQPLDRLFARHDHLHLRILGCGRAAIPTFEHVRYSTRPTYDEEEMIREILGMHIGLFPAPADIEDYRIRGALKAMLYMSGGAVPVCFNAGDSRNVIEDGVNGMLVDDTDQWFTKLDALATDASRLKMMRRRAQESIRQGHSMEHVFGRLEAVLVEIANLP